MNDRNACVQCCIYRDYGYVTKGRFTLIPGLWR